MTRDGATPSSPRGPAPPGGLGHVLVVDDEPATREALKDILRGEGYQVEIAPSGAQALERLREGGVDVVLADLVMPDVTGLKILEAAHGIDREIRVILVTGYGTVETAVDAMRKGAYHYLTKPVRSGELKALVAKAMGERRLVQQVSQLQSRLDSKFGFGGVIGVSPAVERLVELVRRVAPTPSTVLLTGESGTGKELIANCLHQNSPRRDRPFVKVNCAALVENLLESELFGHVQGAFTGALKDKSGKFELADGGTILLDEIGEMSPATQAKLLRVLQEREIERVGGEAPRKIDVRVIASTNRNLEEQVKKNEFREDLYYRLKVVRIELPPLRERVEDVPLFVERFIDELGKSHGRKVRGVSPAVIERFKLYHWPGNVRELKNTLEGMIATSPNEVLDLEDLPAEIREHDVPPDRLRVPVGTTLEEIEMEMIRRTLETTGGNRTRAAKLLGVSLRTLQRKLKVPEDEAADEDGEAP